MLKIQLVKLYRDRAKEPSDGGCMVDDRDEGVKPVEMHAEDIAMKGVM